MCLYFILVFPSCLIIEDCHDARENCRGQWHCVDGRCKCEFRFGGPATTVGAAGAGYPGGAGK